jgi:hypothetical protein
MTKPKSITVMIEFLTFVCSEGKMRDWLGQEGHSFWLPLLSLLCSRPVENPSISAFRYLDLIYSKKEKEKKRSARRLQYHIA